MTHEYHTGLLSLKKTDRLTILTVNCSFSVSEFQAEPFFTINPHPLFKSTSALESMGKITGTTLAAREIVSLSRIEKGNAKQTGTSANTANRPATVFRQKSPRSLASILTITSDGGKQ